LAGATDGLIDFIRQAIAGNWCWEKIATAAKERGNRKYFREAKKLLYRRPEWGFEKAFEAHGVKI